MPQIRVMVFRESQVDIPLVKLVKSVSKEAYTEYLRVIVELEKHGHELDRPDSGYLKKKLRELRPKVNKVRHRILYFHDTDGTAYLCFGFIKKTDRVPSSEITRTLKAKEKILQDKAKYSVSASVLWGLK